jgi:hypothetical protein
MTEPPRNYLDEAQRITTHYLNSLAWLKQIKTRNIALPYLSAKELDLRIADNENILKEAEDRLTAFAYTLQEKGKADHRPAREAAEYLIARFKDRLDVTLMVSQCLRRVKQTVVVWRGGV